MVRRIGLVLVVLLAMGLAVTPGGAIEEKGSSPGNPMDMGGTLSGTLAPGGFFWYRFWDPGENQPQGVTMNFAPATVENKGAVGFGVWMYRNTPTGPVLTEIGRGSPPTRETLGVKYWRGQSSKERTIFVQVTNFSSAAVDYATALTGAAYPPPGLVIAPVKGAPALEPTAVAPPPPPQVTGGGTSPEEAVQLIDKPITGKLGPDSRSWFLFHSKGGGRPTGVTFNFNPVTETNKDEVLFRVWINRATPVGYVMTAIGRGTTGVRPAGSKYWRGGADAQRPHYIEVINHSQEWAGYAIAVSDTWPPLWLEAPDPHQ